MPISLLKIDGSFVRNVTKDKHDADVVKAIIALADALQLGVVAEGVETKEQADFLIKNGCIYAQVFFILKQLVLRK